MTCHVDRMLQIGREKSYLLPILDHFCLFVIGTQKNIVKTITNDMESFSIHDSEDVNFVLENSSDMFDKSEVLPVNYF